MCVYIIIFDPRMLFVVPQTHVLQEVTSQEPNVSCVLLEPIKTRMDQFGAGNALSEPRRRGKDRELVANVVVSRLRVLS